MAGLGTLVACTELRGLPYSRVVSIRGSLPKNPIIFGTPHNRGTRHVRRLYVLLCLHCDLLRLNDGLSISQILLATLTTRPCQRPPQSNADKGSCG
jgi:hypothetical protein